MLALGEVARKHNLFLISDEVYREFCYTDEPHFSAMNIPDLADNVILVDSVSKRYNLCGCRIGCIVSLYFCMAFSRSGNFTCVNAIQPPYIIAFICY